MGHLLKKSKRKKKDTWKYMKMGTQYSKIYEAQQRQLLQISLWWYLTRISTLATFIQHSIGNLSHGNQRRKKRKHPNWKGKSKTITVCRWYDTVHKNPMLLLLSCFSRVQLCATPETAAHQAPLSLGFSRQEHWSGLPFPSPMHESEKSKWSRSVMPDS